MGSVKDIAPLGEDPTLTKTRPGRFDFSDRYSVFDWGEMPDHIPDSGASRCMASAYFFELLRGRDVRTHYLGLGKELKNALRTYQTESPVSSMLVDLVVTVKPVVIAENGTTAYNYSFFQNAGKNGDGGFVLPLEFICRRKLPKQSSVFKRLGDGRLTPKTLGLSSMPVGGHALPTTFVDPSTKFEQYDRYPDERKGESADWFMANLAGMTPEEIEKARDVVLKVDGMLAEVFDVAGFDSEDGKVELIFYSDRKLAVGDAIGTLDECRITYPLDGVRVEMSKQIPRDYYRSKQPGWVAEIEGAKATGEKDWKKLVKLKPNPLPSVLVTMMSQVYGAVTNAVLGRNLFDAPTLHDIAADYKRYKDIEGL